MANSIFPDTGSGAVVIRDIDGNCLAPPDVHNTYCPPDTYVMNCEVAAIPSTCEARIEPRQINAIVSELLSLAECLDPDGPWDCNSVSNLCAAFEAWALANNPALPLIDGVSIIGTGVVGDEFRVGTVDGGVY
jgi:hypothetical protein